MSSSLSSPSAEEAEAGEDDEGISMRGLLFIFANVLRAQLWEKKKEYSSKLDAHDQS